MTFNSAEFIVFLAVFLALWPWLRQRDQRRWFGITVFSFFFYCWWDWRFGLLLAATGLIDYAAALGMVGAPRHRKLLLWLSIGSNVAVLFFFKYAGFAATELSLLFDWPGDDVVGAARGIILPVGISFYTFQSMSYTIDVYRGQLTPTRSALHFLAYLSLFPQLVAGPIIRAVDLLPSLKGPGEYNAVNRWRGLERIALGFFKKVVIADNLAPVVNELFATGAATSLPGGLAWLAAILFGLQIYCDFSGYSDIAIGIARWMGYHFPENFLRPYTALGFREFWSRWHISLSTWFRDYVYLPLGGSRAGPVRRTANLWCTMLLSGLWHGANATFIAWGAMHAALLSIERATGWPERCKSTGALRAAGWLLTFALVTLAWVFFRAETITQALTMMQRMFTDALGGLDRIGATMRPTTWLAVGAYGVLALATTLTERKASRWLAHPAVRFSAVVLALTAAVFLRGSGNDFIYFQF